MRLEIRFRHEQGVGTLKDRGVLDGLVVALGHAQDDDPQMLAQIEAGRADQIADVLDQQYIGRIQVELFNCRRHHRRVEMAGSFRIKLHDRHPESFYALGVDGPGDVALDDRKPQSP